MIEGRFCENCKYYELHIYEYPCNECRAITKRTKWTKKIISYIKTIEKVKK